jgi:FKBP-type peptidyl-prolyl cis-trans isomerase FkpA
MRRRIVTAGAAVWTALAACSGAPTPAGTAPAPEQTIDQIVFAPVLAIDLPKYTRTRSGAYYLDIVTGTGTRAAIDRGATLRYAVFLPTGVPVEVQKEPVTVKIGPDVIRGWRETIPGMRAGGVRRLILPPELAYGRAPYGKIPGNSTLVFEIELLSVQ